MWDSWDLFLPKAREFGVKEKGDGFKQGEHASCCVCGRGAWRGNLEGMSWDGDGSVLGQLGSGYTSLVSITIAIPRNLYQDLGVKLLGQRGRFLFPVFRRSADTLRLFRELVSVGSAGVPDPS